MAAVTSTTATRTTVLPSDLPTAPRPSAAVSALHRLELALGAQVVANFDNYGSLWGFSTVEETEELIARERTGGADIDEWVTVDRDGRPLRVVRIADPTFLDTICVFSAWGPYARAVRS
ncbi:hypothetical protein ACWD25_25395 [Streptomyces sp. NPDC002920]